ncbi:MAG: DUF2459 domain-containing protein [Candidatus Binatia bacterium]
MPPAGASLRIIVASLVFCLFGCSGQARSVHAWNCVQEESNCRSVFIVHDSWHAAIVLRKDDLPSAAFPELADFPEARFIEFSWGDKDYFPDPNSGFSMALKAAFWSSGSVLHVVGFTENVATLYRAAQIVELRVTPAAYARLIAYLSQSFSRPQNARAQASPGLVANSRFYPSTHKFSLLKTCNTWVAESLQTAGLPVSPGLIITAGQLADQIAEIKSTR